MDTTVRRSEHIVWNIVDGESVLLSPNTGKYYGLNRTATEIWKFLEVSHTINELESFIGSRFNAPADALTHIEALLDDLHARKLITYERNQVL